jgi:hypothetical protein
MFQGNISNTTQQTTVSILININSKYLIYNHELQIMHMPWIRTLQKTLHSIKLDHV